MRIGICGFAGGGRSTLFTALTGATPAPPSGNPLVHRSVATVPVPDARLEWMRTLFSPKKYTPATVEFVDFAGIPRSAEKGKAELMAAMREMDALLMVVSGFSGAADALEVVGTPGERLRALDDEFLFADLEIVERRVEKLEANLKKGIVKTRDRDEREIELMRRCRTLLEAGESLEQVAKNKEDEEFLSTYRFLRQKPTIGVVTLDETQDSESIQREVSVTTARPLFAIRSVVEAEIATMPEEDRAAFREEYGLDQPARDAIIAAAFKATRSIPFFTVGEDECRAWVIREGDNALAAAGKIHSDIARGFIRAEVTPYEEIRRLGSMRAAKADNFQRLEGKEYVVQDGDIVHFRFSV